MKLVQDKKISLDRKRVEQELESLHQKSEKCEISLMEITIGITARNEQATIRQIIDSLVSSAY